MNGRSVDRLRTSDSSSRLLLLHICASFPLADPRLLHPELCGAGRVLHPRMQGRARRCDALPAHIRPHGLPVEHARQLQRRLRHMQRRERQGASLRRRRCRLLLIPPPPTLTSNIEHARPTPTLRHNSPRASTTTTATPRSSSRATPSPPPHTPHRPRRSARPSPPSAGPFPLQRPRSRCARSLPLCAALCFTGVHFADQ